MPKRLKMKLRIRGNAQMGGKNNDDGSGEERVVEEERIEYWTERERVWRSQEAGKREEATWNEVEEIFIEEPLEIRDVLGNNVCLFVLINP